MAPKTNAPALPFAVDTGIALPAITRGGGGGAESDVVKTMKALALATDPKKYQSFFIPVGAAPETITVDKEKDAWAKEAARKIANRVSGASRRLAKADESLSFAIRTMNDANGKLGVRVYRVPKSEAK